MRLPALIIAAAALAGLAACDSNKMSELTGAKPAQTVAIGGRPAVTAGAPAATSTCPPNTTPACLPAQPALAPEAPKAAPKAVAGPARHWARPRHVAWRGGSAHHGRKTVIVRRVIITETRLPPVRHYGYVGEPEGLPYARAPHGYVERHYERRYGPPPHMYGPPPPPAYGEQEYREGRRADGSYERDYRYEHHEVTPPHGVYVEERRDDRYGGGQAYSYQRQETGRSDYSYERRESSSSVGAYISGGRDSGAYGHPDDCDCRPQAAGRDRQGFLTWPGKQP